MKYFLTAVSIFGLAITLSASQVESVLLLKEMQRVYPGRADEFQKYIDSIKKNKGVTDKQIEDAYVVQLKEFCANNQ